MPVSIRPRRSSLYMPGSNARALDKGRSLPADQLILDLEDAVAPDAKVEARRLITAALAEGGYGRREILVRTNGLDSPWGYDDVKTMAGCGAHGLLLPKVESADMVRRADRLMTESGAPVDMAIWCMLETPLGILNAREIATASPRLAGFVMGTSDLAKDLHARHTPDRLPFLYALNTCVLVARAHGLVALDGVHLDLGDDAGFEASCRQGLELGFDGKTLIHPKTIEMANTVFGPTAPELAEAEAIIDAFEKAVGEGKGVVVLNGRLVENLHVDNARRLLGLARMIEEMAG